MTRGGRGDYLFCRQVFAHHWEAADCAGTKLAEDQCLLSYGSLPGKGGQCGRGFPQWCCASTWARWRSWGERLGAQGCSTWKKYSGAIRHMDGGMAILELPWENQQMPAQGLEGWGMKLLLSLSYDTESTVGLLYTHGLITPPGGFESTGCYSLKGCNSILYWCKQRLLIKRCFF